LAKLFLEANGYKVERRELDVWYDWYK
jgi:hypothetical protein